jgi:hypothetical protein
MAGRPPTSAKSEKTRTKNNNGVAPRELSAVPLLTQVESAGVARRHFDLAGADTKVVWMLMELCGVLFLVVARAGADRK